MKKKILGAAMTLAAAVSMSLLAIPSATAVDDSLDDSRGTGAHRNPVRHCRRRFPG
ncbi:hypothetical protein [Mobiluncus mulieris]|uniref:hypothetical protein n=1 Tax=Mobiluncus mulieris TaxID=2052 RepID=UPI00146FE235|nr:hypothetical protein [Mobiluncus mulieris]NMW74462.1 hypothetical protein [Mobiluncus mulieris]